LASDLTFDGGTPLRETTAGAVVSWRATDRLTLAITGGALVGGSLGSAGKGTLQPGPFGGASVTYALLTGEGGGLFSTVTGGASVLTTRTGTGGAGPRLTAVDVRVAGILGLTLAGRFSPYLGAALFGGPVFLVSSELSQTGSDAWHVQTLLGFSVALPGGFDLFAEGSPLFERTLSGGVGVAFW
jgi:hypothetical protein